MYWNLRRTFLIRFLPTFCDQAHNRTMTPLSQSGQLELIDNLETLCMCWALTCSCSNSSEASLVFRHILVLVRSALEVKNGTHSEHWLLISSLNCNDNLMPLVSTTKISHVSRFQNLLVSTSVSLQFISAPRRVSSLQCTKMKECQFDQHLFYETAWSILFWNHKNYVTSLVKFCMEKTSRRRIFSVDFD